MVLQMFQTEVCFITLIFLLSLIVKKKSKYSVYLDSCSVFLKLNHLQMSVTPSYRLDICIVFTNDVCILHEFPITH